MAPHDIVSGFLDAMRAAGVEPAEPIADVLLSGERARFQCVGDTKGRKNGWARLYLDERPAGVFGTYKGDFRSTWAAERPVARLSKGERAEYRARCEAERKAKAVEKAAQHEAVAIEAQAMITTGHPATAHGYLSLKRISGEGMLLAGRALLVPMQDAVGKIWNVQRIYPDRSKLFLKGGRIDGLFWLVGGEDGPLCIGEGVGTMAAVRRATGHAVAAGINSGNLEKAARELRLRWPDRPMIICADDDAHLVNHPRIRRNIGVDAARAAAAAIGARIALPPRSAEYG